MSIKERLARLLTHHSEETQRDPSPTGDTWSYVAYHSPEDWEAHRLKELRKFNEHVEDMKKPHISDANSSQPTPPSTSPYGGGSRLTERRNLGERTDRERGWTK